MASAVDFAESSQWSKLDKLIKKDKSSADEVDDFGMTALHWACTDHNVPFSLIRNLLSVNAKAAFIKNEGGLYPLHIAIKAKLSLRSIKALCNANQEAVSVDTPTGESVMDLALSTGLDQEVIDYLSHMEEGFRESSATNRFSKRRHDTTVSEDIPPMSIKKRTQSTGLMLPPRWKQENQCNICSLRFSYLKNRHHCRNCGNSVCSNHSTKKMPLSHIGLSTPQRVCLLCYDELSGPPSSRFDVVGEPSDTMGERLRSQTLLTSTSNNSRKYSDKAKTMIDSELRHRRSNSVGTNNYLPRGMPREKKKAPPEITRNESLDIIEGNSSDDDSNCPSDVDNNEAEMYESMQKKVKQLESHVSHLLESKNKIREELFASKNEILEAKRMKNLAEMRIKELEEEDKSSNNLLNCTSTSSATLCDDMDEACTQYYLGTALFDNGDYCNAISSFRKAFELRESEKYKEDPNNSTRQAEVLYFLSQSYFATSDYEQAEVALTKAMQKNPNNICYLSLSGKIMHAKGDHDGAINVFREALSNMKIQKPESDGAILEDTKL